MTELETLKDMPHIALPNDAKEVLVVEQTIDNITFLSETLLKRELIKWINSKHCRNFATAFDSDIMSNASEAVGAGKILKHIFNITEEDLK